jgi:hypothetical protein
MSADLVRHLQPVEDTPPLIVVNEATGERMGPLEDFTQTSEDALATLTHKYHAALAEITKLKRDKEAEARRHECWAEIEALHDWYAIATGHPGRKFGAEEFMQALPRIKAVGPIEFLHAVAGVAFDPKKSSRPQRNGRYTYYDSWEHLTRNAANLQSYIDRAPGDPDGHKWKRFLIAHIEGQFK